MKVYLIILSILLFPCLLYGQKDTSEFKIVIRGEPSYTAYPTLFLVIGTTKIQLDSLSIKKIEPNWIKRMEVIKEERYQNIYGNKDGVVFIYIKKRFHNRILKLLDSEITTHYLHNTPKHLI